MKWDYPARVVRDVFAHAQDNAASTLWRIEAPFRPVEARQVRELPPAIVLQAYLEWNGVHGFHRDVLSITSAEAQS